MSKHRIEKDFLGTDILTDNGRVFIQLSWSWIRPKKRRWFCRITDFGKDIYSTTKSEWTYGYNKFEAYRTVLKKMF